MTTSNQQAAWAFRQHQIGRTQVLDLPRRRQAGRRRPCGLAPEPSVFVLKQPPNLAVSQTRIWLNSIKDLSHF